MSVLAPLAPYRSILALPRVRSLVLVTLLARIPVGAASVALTLHVVLSLRGGYGAAGAVGAALTVGGAVGAPLMGRTTDRHGLRRTLLVTTLAQGAFWLVAPALPYVLLVPAALFGGLLSLPLFSVSRQSLAALVPEDRRRTAYSLDSMAVEVSYMVGPAGGVLLATQLSTRLALLAIGASMLLSGLLLYLLDPPVRSDAELRQAEGQAPIPRREWINGRLVVVLVASMGATLVLSGTDIGIVATLRHAGELKWSGLVIATWCCWSLAGGFIHGSLPRSLPAMALMELLCVLTIPVGLATHWWALALALIPAGLMCAPTIAATGEVVSRLAPAVVRGEAMGLHGSALTAGIAVGAPLVGVVVDRSSPAMGFAVGGAAGALLGLIGVVAGRRWPAMGSARHQPEEGSPPVRIE